MKTVIKYAFSFAASLALSSAALAAGGYAAGAIGAAGLTFEYSGNAGGWTEGGSSGGSQAITNNYGNGLALQAAGSATDGYAYSGGGADLNSSYSYQGGNSDSIAYSGGFEFGNGTGNSGSGAGTDYTAGSYSNFETNVNAGGFIIGAFGGFDSFTW